LVTSGNLLPVVGLRIISVQEEAVFTNLVDPLCIFFPNPFVKTRVCIVVDLGMGSQLYIERVAGNFELMLGIVQQGVGAFHLILVPNTLHKDLALALNIRETLARSHYAGY
jgi:hypothetical protein